MTSLLEYKCPCCDASIDFDSSLQKMKCPYCGTEFDVETLAAYNDELSASEGASDDMNWETQAGGEWSENEQQKMRVYVCNSCGGEIVCDETTSATECPYCANAVIMKGQLAGDLKPDYVIPFKIDKKGAVEALKAHYKGKTLLPRVFKDENKIEEVKGVYVPFWLFDADVNAGIRYKASRVRMWSDSKYNYTETSFYSVIRDGKVSFERVPVDGSEKMDDALMESLEPFDFSQAVEFLPAYLSGFLADRYDVDAKQSEQRANERIKKSTEEVFASTVVGYSSVIPVSSNVRLSNGTAKYALYPVWLLNTVWNGQKYTFAVNGQTGKTVGNLPMDKGLYWLWLLGIGIGAGAVCFLLQNLLGLM